MSRILGVLVMALLLAPRPALAGELTLRDVIELHRTGLGDDLLIAVIDADGGPFKLSFADIQDLKSDGLTERVIAALVRTGARAAAREMAPPLVHVSQEVLTYAPTVIVVETPGWRHPDRTPAGAKTAPEAAGPAPATWVTRLQDGKNVTASGEVLSSSAPATWVTPRDPRPREASEPQKPRSTPR